MQQNPGQTSSVPSNGPRLSTSSHSSITGTTSNLLLNGLLPSHRYSQSLSNAPILGSNLSSNQFSQLRKGSEQIKRSERAKQILIRIFLSIILAFLFLTTIEFSVQLVRPSSSDRISKRNRSLNHSGENEEIFPPIRGFFTCVWFFNLLLFLNSFIIYFLLRRRNPRRTRTFAGFIRDFLRIFDNEKNSTNPTFLDYLLKISILSFLWYLTCYFFFRSMSILIPAEIVILFSITVTSRQLLGWIFLHEQFIGNKIIAHILALSALLFLAHNDGFRFNRFLLGLTIITFAMGFKTTFDVLVNAFIKDLNQTKLTLLMINVLCLGTLFLWPLVLLLHFTRLESIDSSHLQWMNILIALISALAFNLLSMMIPFEYTSICNAAYFLLLIPSTSILDRYLFGMKYSPLVISAMICSFAGVFLSMIPKEWFQASETGKMKQAFALLNKDGTTNAQTSTSNTTNPTSGTSSAFEEIRAQRRMRNALLYNDGKT